MQFTFQVQIEVSRIEGKFASRDDIGEQLQQALSDADPATLEGENGGQFDVDTWEVSDISDPKKVR